MYRNTDNFALLLSGLEIKRIQKTRLARDFYVDASGGSDRIGNGTKESPFSSIGMALAWIQPLHTIYVSDGVYCGYNMNSKIVDSVSIVGQSSGGTVLNGLGKIYPFKVTGTNLIFKVSTLSIVYCYTSNSTYGGAIILLNGGNNTGVLENLLLYNNADFSNRGSITLRENASLNITGCQFRNNSNSDYNQNPTIGVASLSNSHVVTYLNIFNSVFNNDNNYLYVDFASSIVIDSSVFIGNHDDLNSCSCSIFRSNLVIRNCSFSESLSGQICLTNSTSYVSNSYFKDNYFNFYATQSTLEVHNSEIHFMHSSQGGVMMLSKNSYAHLYNCSVSSTSVYTSPNLMFSMSQSTLLVNSSLLVGGKGTMFSTLQGDLQLVDAIIRDTQCLLISASQTKIRLSNSQFLNSTYFDEVFKFNTILEQYNGAYVLIIDCLFQDIYGYIKAVNSRLIIHNSKLINSGKFFDIDKSTSLNLEDCQFISNFGPIFVLNGPRVHFFNCTFQYNYGSEGSIIQGSNNLFLEAANCTFESNIALSQGGIAVIGDQSTLNFLFCTFRNNTSLYNGGIIYAGSLNTILFYFTILDSNTAKNGGGSIVYFIEKLPIFGNCTLTNNNAYFGGIIASNPTHLQLASGEFPSVIVSRETIFSGIIRIGNNLNQIYPNPSYNHLRVYLMVNGNTIATVPFEDGYANFTNIVIYGQVGGFSTVIFSCNESSLEPLTIPYNVTIMPCNPGYYPIDSSTKCAECPPGSYGYNGNICISCPQNALCEGGDQVSTRPGYWFDENQFPRVIYDCDQSSHCLANNTCLEHTFGVLCSSCNNTEQYYSWFGGCIECTQTNKLVIAIVIIGMILLVLWSHKSDSSSGLMNIVVYFAQTIMVLSKGVNFSILSLLNLQLESGGSSIIGSICPGPFDYYERHYMTFLVFPAVIFILLIFTLIITIIRKFKPNDQPIFPRQFGSFVKLLMNIYSPISTATFTIFFCQQIGIGNSVLVTDSSVQCSGNQYRTALKISYSMLIVVLGIPMIIFILLFKNRKHNNDASIIRTYGAFILKYKTSYYYWDVILLFRRLVIVLVSIMDQDTPIRSFLLIGVSLISVLLQLKHSPFISEGDNQLELVSLILIFISCIYLGNEIESYLEDWIIIVCFNENEEID
ncbi:Pol [Heterostelium album PN500]|uniref:Pol n=1 Tax=Heterostelium pallidum (strain ATCC 26659 / Pp 5 / PN500) TaxID=670386 RepID=D3BJN5_HETP5|nr:Pol [Heterostelium album PN500]EFA78115.1 Pol [Heterostelium album PN500]|eukprot:XP_020430241.1 Pol [Heterostelium album PN500]